MNCPGCHKEVGCNVDMLLVPAKRQLPHSFKDYRNDGVLVLEFLKCGNFSKEQRVKICERWGNFIANWYGDSWAFVSPYEESTNAKEATSTTLEEQNAQPASRSHRSGKCNRKNFLSTIIQEG